MRAFLLLAVFICVHLWPFKTLQAASQPGETTIEVFSDFQCPFCRSFAPAIAEIRSKGIYTVKFRYFPLSIHSDAQIAAQAAAAADEQGKFWEMHDLLSPANPL